jgi:hypothetical protein
MDAVHEQHGRMPGRRGRKCLAVELGGVPRNPDLERGARRRPAPGRKSGLPQLGGKHTIHLALGSRHELLRDIGDRSHAVQGSCHGLDRLPDARQRPAQPLETLSLISRELSQQGLRVGRPIPSRATGSPNGRTAAQQTFQCGIGVGPGEPGRTCYGVARRRSELEQRSIDDRLSGSKAEGCEIDRRSSNSYYYFLSQLEAQALTRRRQGFP